MLVVFVPSVFAAYAFSRFRFRFKTAIMFGLLILNAFPQILTMFALFRLFRLTGLINTTGGLVIVYAGSMTIFSVWNIKGYFDSIPTEIEEAARIDGLSEAGILFRVILPLARPAIIVTGVMVLISVWNEYIFSTTFITEPANYTLAGGLYILQAGDYSRNYPLFAAASLLTSLPIVILFFVVQKYMVSGLTAGAVKK